MSIVYKQNGRRIFDFRCKDECDVKIFALGIKRNVNFLIVKVLYSNIAIALVYIIACYNIFL